MFPWLFFRIGYQLLRSLSGHLTTERRQNLLIKRALHPASSYGVRRIRLHGVRHFPETLRYQLLRSLPGHRITERRQNLLTKDRWFSTPPESVHQIRSHGEISVPGAYESTTCPWGYLSVLYRIGQRYLLVFFKRAMRCNILRNKCLSYRHLPDMPRIRYHRVIPV